MNKWFYRAVGTVGIAGGFLLLGGGAAQAEDVDATPPSDPQQLQGLLDGFFTPLGGKDFSQVNLGSNGKGASSDLVLGGRLDSLVGDVAPTRDLGFVGSAPSSPTASVSSDALGHGSLDRALGHGSLDRGVARDSLGRSLGADGEAHAGKPSLISDLPVAGTFTDTVGATRAVDSLGLGGTTDTLLNGANGMSANAGKMDDLVPATSDVDTSRAGAAVPASLGLVPAGAIPTVDTGKAVRGNTNGVTRSTRSQAQDLVPALIGDAMTAQNPELFTRSFEFGEPEALPPVATLPLLGDLNLKGVPGAADNPTNDLPILSSLRDLGLPGAGAPATTLPAPAADDADAKAPSHRRHSTNERPVAGEDADFAEGAQVGLPLVGDVGNVTRVLPTNGSLAGAPGLAYLPF
ncbi:hypothetical protein RB614_19125 [Phytohabitans sp. ZYX-F-186]|uniref:Uncharacterized protein n=1 Tax=Phytohabitans maris TaxID=3071409 RepID=A0ABU0ZHV2_9ACTN|nr:hypothetical protein [Phytohabitans sp. ZYX-F-186]MDQ7906631.1 hypothetical protein [Phytohabitans sp. ZYX-F-186]